MDANKVKPELAGGFRDYLPQDMIPRNKMLTTIKQVFERFGFLPMDTPGMEKDEVLGKEGSDFLIYKAGIEGGQDMALRYDLTVPLARFYASNADKLPKPFKRYQFGRVWRGEKQQTGKGRWREFTQLDIDTVGSSDVMADAEVVAIMYAVLSELDLGGNFSIKVNNRKVFEGLSDTALRIIDKLDKAGQAEVEKELADKCTTAELELAKKLFSPDKIINTELQQLLEYANTFSVPSEVISVDNTIVRGLGYYTGNIFEASITSLPELGSIFSGGRYDNLVSRFAPINVPAVGASVGVDRLFTALDQLGLLKRETTTAKILVLNFDVDSRAMVGQTAIKLRQNDIATEIYLGQEDTLKGQLSYAVKQEYPYVIIIGAEEKQTGYVTLKDMFARTQKKVQLKDIVQEISGLLK